MQKIQLYLVPNKLTVTTDRAGFNTEFTQVYQRKLKIYKGIDNTIQLDVRNSEQRKTDVTGKTATIKFFDSDRKVLFEAAGTPITSQPGQITVTISSTDIADISPQKLIMAAYLTDTGVDEIVYVDGQFEIFGNVELLDGYNGNLAEGTIIEELKIFNYEYDRKEYVSEIGTFGTRLNDDVGVTRTITVGSTGVYQGNIIVEATQNMSTAFGTQWTELGIWNVGTDSTKDFTGNWRFVRFRIPSERISTAAGSGARFTVTKTDGVYTNVTVTLRGQNYLIGDTLTIPGGQLGGLDDVNDITVNITGVTNGVTSQGNVDQFTWTGTATAGTEVYESIATDSVTRPPNPVDTITIRN